PSTTRFSPKSPSDTSAPAFLNASMASLERRLTCRCHFPAWASPIIPKSRQTTASSTFVFPTPRFSLTHIALTFPIFILRFLPFPLFLFPSPTLCCRNGALLFSQKWLSPLPGAVLFLLCFPEASFLVPALPHKKGRSSKRLWK